MTSTDFLRALLERAIEDDLVWPSETDRPIPTGSDLGYLRHLDATEFAAVVGMLDRFIAARSNMGIQTAVVDGHWTAWRAGRPELAFGGPTERDAVLRLLEASEELCDACGGSGQYVGLQSTAACQECGGRGRKSPTVTRPGG